MRAIVEEFAPRFAPGAAVLYLGDAGDKFARYEESVLAALGVVVEEHGPMPDVVLHLADRGWLVLVEAVTSHGPIHPMSKRQLADLFAGSTAVLLYVTAFPNLKTFLRYAKDLAWETHVWTADNPTHLIHFNGDRFLGPR